MEMKPLSKSDFDKILDLKKYLTEKSGRKANAEFENVAVNVVNTLDSVGFMPVFDYIAWLDSMNMAYDFVINTDVLKNADLETLRKIMTANVRIDRFSDGHLERLIESGYMGALLSRLEELS